MRVSLKMPRIPRHDYNEKYIPKTLLDREIQKHCLRQQFQSVVRRPLEIPKTVSRGLKSQNYFHSNTKTFVFLFSFNFMSVVFQSLHDMILPQSISIIYENPACLLKSLSQTLTKRFVKM